MIKIDVIGEIKAKTDLIELFESYGHRVQKNGKTHVTNCPFHEDETPSLSISPSKKLWNCFGCGEAGDLFKLVQKKENCNFPEAVKKLAEQSGFELEMSDEKNKDPNINTSSFIESNKVGSPFLKAARYYQARLFDTESGRAYLQSRNLKNEELWRTHEIGFCDGTLTKIFPELESELKAANLILENGRERFVNCITFPLKDEKNEIVGLYGRHIKEEKGGHFYLPGARKGLFNRENLSSKTPLIIAESVIDAMSFIEAGYPNVLPIYGTKGFMASHMSLIETLKPSEIILALDGDEEGQRASLELKEVLFSFRYSVFKFPENKDANEYFRENKLPTPWPPSQEGGTPFFKGAPPLLDPVLNLEALPQRSSFFQLKFAEQRGNKLNATLKCENKETGKFLLETYNLYNAKQRETLIEEAAKILNEDPKLMAAEIARLIPIAEAKARRSRGSDEGGENASEESPVMSKSDENEAMAFLKNPDIFASIRNDYDKLGYIGEETNKVLAYLVMTSRKMKNPLSMIIMSNSAAGKSSLQKATMELCPDEDGKHFTRLTQQSLYYLGEESIKHKCLSIEEEEGSSEASYSLKVLLSAKVLNVVTTTQDPQTGRKRADEYKTEGPVAVMVSTTSPEIEPELESRVLVISVDESQAQTRQIQAQQRESRTLAGQEIEAKREAIKAKHHNAQRLLETNLTIVNNFAPTLTFPTQRLRFRRTHAHYLDLIETVAFLRQKQKTIKPHPSLERYIEVDETDLAIAKKIFDQILGQALAELKPSTKEVLNKITEFCQKEERKTFQRREIRSHGNYTHTHLHRQLKLLEELEYIVPVTGSATGSRYTYELAFEGSFEEKSPQNHSNHSKPFQAEIGTVLRSESRTIPGCPAQGEKGVYSEIFSETIS